MKEKYPHIKRIYVRSAFQHIPDWYEDSLLEHYEDTYFPEHMDKAGKASYVERNQEMINKSDFCIVYYDENYAQPRRKNNKRDLFDYQPKSGTKVALNYAIKKGTCVKNVFTQLQVKCNACKQMVIVINTFINIFFPKIVDVYVEKWYNVCSCGFIYESDSWYKSYERQFPYND